MEKHHEFTFSVIRRRWFHMICLMLLFVEPIAAQLSVGTDFQGGKIAYFLKSGDPGYDATKTKGLIVSNSDLTGKQWAIGSYTSSSTGVVATAFGTGASNTKALVNLMGPGNYYAYACDTLTLGGYTDWYLPSKEEQVMVASAAFDFLFNENNYWTSSEDNGDGNDPNTDPGTGTLSTSLTWSVVGGSSIFSYPYGKNVTGIHARPIRNFEVSNCTPTSSTSIVSTCGSYSWNGQTYTNSGTYTWTGTNAAGCDSIATLNLTIITGAAAPTNLVVTPVNTGGMIQFNTPACDGGNPITNYEYSTDNGVTWVTPSPAITSSPLIISSGLSNCTSYQVKIRSVNSSGSGAASEAATLIPRVSKASGVDWTMRDAASGNNWKSLTYGNGLFVAVASDGTGDGAMTSPDGITWTTRVPATDNQWVSVTFGNGLFVAVSYDSSVMTSPDGINWTSRVAAAAYEWSSVTFGNGLFVAVASNGNGDGVMTSPDGITWTLRVPAADLQWYSITYGNGLFVAVSYNGSGNQVMTSPNGIDWTSRTTPVDLDWESVTYGNGLFVAVADNGSGSDVMTSPDGITWTIRTTPENNFYSVTYGNGLFVAVASDGLDNDAMTSPDGITWTSQKTFLENYWNVVGYGNGLFVALQSTQLMTSTFSPAADAPVITSTSVSHDTATVNFTQTLPFFANQVSNYEYTLDNGANWTTASPADSISPIIIPGLTTGVAYHVKLRAVNSAGVSCASESFCLPNTSTSTATSCYSHTWNNQTYYTSGTYTWTGTNTAGCDSVATLNLTIINNGPAAPVPPSGLKVENISIFASSGVKSPTSFAFDDKDNIYFSTNSNDSIYKISPTGVVTPFWKVPGAAGIVIDASGNGYVGSSGYNSVFKLTPAGVSSTYASGVYYPSDLVFDTAGNLYAGSQSSGMITKITPAGDAADFVDSGGTLTYGLAFDRFGNLYAAHIIDNNITKITPNSSVSTFVSGTGSPAGLVFDKYGYLYVSNPYTGTIDKISPSGVITTIATGLDGPGGLKFDKNGNLYVAFNTGNNFSRITFGTDSVNICKGSSATLHAITENNSTTVVDWYDAQSGGSLLATDTSFVTPVLDTTKIFYAESRIVASGCVSTTRTAFKVITHAPPALFKVTGGGRYPNGGTGVAVGLDGSQSGVNYQLKIDGRDTLSAVTGTGSALTFGLQTSVGKYTVVANPNSGCSLTMADSAMVGKGPTLYHVTGGGRYCSGGSGVSICLSGSDPGMKYELRHDHTSSGNTLVSSYPTMTGTGSSICFGPITEAATYKIYAKEGPPYVYTQMLDSVVVKANPLPTAYTVTGGGTFCTGGSGVAVRLSGSKTGIKYQLKQGGADTGLSVKGTGSAISFGLQSVAGTYTVLATDTTTFCQKTMTGSVTLKASTPPSIAAIGGGALSVCVNSKTPAFTDATKGGVWSITTSVPTAIGSGSASITSGGIVTGLTAGIVNVTYTVTSGCSASVTKSLTINSLPAAPAAITGTTTVCAGSTTALADATAGGVWSSSSASVATVSGAGVVTGVSAGTTTIFYTVSNGSGCTNASSTTVTVNPRAAQPSTFTKSSASVTQGQTNVAYAVTNVSGVTYSWSYSGTGATITGTTSSVTISFSKTATAGTLSVTATNGCGTSAARTLAITMKKYGTKSVDLTNVDASLNPDVTILEDEFTVYPNPTSGSATFSFKIAESGRVRIDLYSINGQHNAHIFDADVEAGIPQTVLYEQNLPTGIYPCILTYKGKTFSLKLAVRH